ncbi:MAG TPA: zinc-binding alcohol dehydrogenase family protein [Caldilineaceae bacterium]|nr:zinc-binding alcohol dehydrogenase family protein [Caldilineaceae bacterium]
MPIPATMRAIGLYRYLPVTDPDCFVEVELPTPTPTGHDLLVRVQAVSVNPVDTKVRAPKPQIEAEPRILGWDAAGVVEAVGEAVSLFAPGDEVYYAGSIVRPGCNSQYHLVDERITGRKPKRLTFEQAAAMPLTTITAWEAFFDRLGIVPQPPSAQQERSLLIIGGAGGVGSIAIQIAKQVAGLQVVATASRPESAAWCQAMGADVVINHYEPLAEGLKQAGVGEVDYVLCCNSLERYFEQMDSVLKPQGKMCTIVGMKDNQPANLNALMGKSATFCFELMFTRPRYQTPDMQVQHELLNQAAQLFDEGTLRTTLTEHAGVLGVETLRHAHAQLESGRMIGKLVLSGIQ